MGRSGLVSGGVVSHRRVLGRCSRLGRRRENYFVTYFGERLLLAAEPMRRLGRADFCFRPSSACLILSILLLCPFALFYSINPAPLSLLHGCSLRSR